VAVVPVAENAIGSRAYKPHSIIKSFKGLTVRVDNTDAEGRLILGDGEDTNLGLTISLLLFTLQYLFLQSLYL
jgi:hypothetical protein